MRLWAATTVADYISCILKEGICVSEITDAQIKETCNAFITNGVGGNAMMLLTTAQLRDIKILIGHQALIQGAILKFKQNFKMIQYDSI